MGRHPPWLKVQIPGGENFASVHRTLRSHQLNTVCEDARCPNIAECWGQHQTATFMILGDVCTRACAYCAVQSGRPFDLDKSEPLRVARAVGDLNLHHAVITSVDRDDLADGGAEIFAHTVRHIRNIDPKVKIELLTPDFQGSLTALRTVLDSGPDIFSHNIETVDRLYPEIRFKSDYKVSFSLLRFAHDAGTVPFTKTGMMVGLGEEWDEIVQVMSDAANAGVDIMTIGQYLQPTPRHHAIERYYTPDEFVELGDIGREMGIRWIFSGPLVRSSYHAENVFGDMMTATSRA